jgi:uncharacterized LabA/DUF88 family protein
VNFYPNERTILFIDGPDLHGIARSAGLDIDFRKLKIFFQDHCHLLRAFYYTTVVVQEQHATIKPLVDWLDYNGFTLVTKEARLRTGTDGRQHINTNMRVELAVDALDQSDVADHIVFFTSDSAFCHLVGTLQRRGKRVSVVSTLKNNGATVADELRRQVDQFVDIVDLATEICRDPRPKLDDRTPQSRRSSYVDPDLDVDANN